MRLWTEGRFRGANLPLDASLADMNELASWGANLARVTLGEETVRAESPYGFNEAGLLRLEGFLRDAGSAGLKVVVAFKSAPGRKGVSDKRIWQEPESHMALARMWKDFARRYKNSPVLAGYDLLSEPNPELLITGGIKANDLEGTTGDWNLLARRLTQAIREEDRDRPLIVEAPSWAYPRGFAGLKPTGDVNTLYSFHMFTPHRYTHQTPEERIAYPGAVPAHVEPAGHWNKEALWKNLQTAVEFQRLARAPILVGEFGVQRFAPGAERYLRDLLLRFEEAKWSWAFWGFRESPAWNPEYGPDPNRADRQPPERAPLMRLYREFFSLNDHPTNLQDLPLLKDATWVSPMRAVRRKFTGQPGTVGLYGDSITFGSQFFGPMFTGGYLADPKTLADLDRFREIVPPYVADWKSEAHGNMSGWRLAAALPGLSQVLENDNPEVAIVMFGTNDMNRGTPEEVGFAENLDRFVRTLMENGTVPILSTLPPKQGMPRKVREYNAVIQRIAHEHHLPLIDYYGAVMRRRPLGWYRTLIIGDGVHPSYPEAFQKDMTERGLRESGFTLRNYLALQAVLSVLDRIR
jgi:hypothetical protein